MKLFFSLKTIAALIISCVIFSTTALGHGGNHHPISAKKAQFLATKVANQFTKKDQGLGFGQLSENWLNLPVEQTAIHKKTEAYYIVKLNNIKEDKVFYVLMSISGEVYDANFSGDFKGLK